MSGFYTNSNRISDDLREATQWLKVPTSQCHTVSGGCLAHLCSVRNGYFSSLSGDEQSRDEHLTLLKSSRPEMSVGRSFQLSEESCSAQRMCSFQNLREAQVHQLDTFKPYEEGGFILACGLAGHRNLRRTQLQQAK